MRIPTLLIAVLFALGLAAGDAAAATRFGGGGNIGKQRVVPTKSVGAKETPASPTASPAATPGGAAAAPNAAGAAAGAAAAAKPSFMSRWGGLLAGLGIGALLGSMFGAEMGPMVGMLLAVALVGGLGLLLFRMFASRNAARGGAIAPATAAVAPMGTVTPMGALAPSAEVAPAMGPEGDVPARMSGFSGIGSRVSDYPAPSASVDGPSASPNFDVPNFLRQARTSFIRLQAASDAKDLDDIRDYTTPELYAEIATQLQDRPEPARTEVVHVDALLADVAIENGYDVASVRFTGLIREDGAANPAPFDEIWHVRKKVGDRNPSWLIAGIQQVAA